MCIAILSTGTLSNESLIGCEQQPCQNGGICESHSGGFRCLCSQQSLNGRLYGGENCTVALLGCDDNQCENGGICSPLLVNDKHTFTCFCLDGFTGPTCQIQTVFSFESRGYIVMETQTPDPQTPINVTFSFKTDREAGTLLQRRVDNLLLRIELLDGHLCLQSLRRQGHSTTVQKLPDYLSDNKWHTVETSLGGNVSRMRLLCTEESCPRDTSAEIMVLEQTTALPRPETLQQSLLIGAFSHTWDSDSGLLHEGENPPAFLGCLRDVFVDSHLVVPTSKPEHFQANVSLGCSNKNKCDERPCQNRGRCVSQGWRSYTCECHRPYEGTNCAEGNYTHLYSQINTHLNHVNCDL